MVAFTLSAVPTGTVDLSTTINLFCMACPIDLATASTYCKSAEPSSPIGVPTAIKAISAFCKASFKAVVKNRFLFFTFFNTMVSKPGSKIGMTPWFSFSILTGSISTQVTLFPISAKQVPETSPTYPDPITVIFISYLSSAVFTCSLSPLEENL